MNWTRRSFLSTVASAIAAMRLNYTLPDNQDDVICTSPELNPGEGYIALLDRTKIVALAVAPGLGDWLKDGMFRGEAWTNYNSIDFPIATKTYYVTRWAVLDHVSGQPIFSAQLNTNLNVHPNDNVRFQAHNVRVCISAV